MAQKILVTDGIFDQALSYMCRRSEWVTDTETTGLDHWHDDVVCGIALSHLHPGAPGFYFPVRHGIGRNLSAGNISRLIEAMNQPDVCHTGWNTKFDLHMLRKEGLRTPRYGHAEDVMLAAHLANENEWKFELKALGAKYIDPEVAKDEDDLKEKLRARGFGKGDMWKLKPSEVKNYACNDVILTRRMRRLYQRWITPWSLWPIWLQINYYMLAMVRMEEYGLRVDMPMLRKLHKEADRNAEQMRADFQQMVGQEVNLNSWQQLTRVLGIPKTNAEFLDSLEDPSPAVLLLRTYRQWEKVRSAYYARYLNDVDQYGILHPNIKLHGTISGRPSAENPNVQAIPRYSDIYKVKDIYVSRVGQLMISLDYSQAELRLGAHIARDENLRSIINSGGDVHQNTAEMVEVDRDTAKRINFGSVYGLGARGLSRKMRIPYGEAEDFLEKWHHVFTNIRPGYEHWQSTAKKQGHIRLWTGRMRRYNVPWAEHRKAFSNAVQGGVAEIMRWAITRIDRDIVLSSPARMLLQVHDQILAEVPDTKKGRRLITEMVKRMEDFPHFNPRPKVDVKVGDRWSTLEKWGAA